jgi:hypothetical protein
MLFDATSQETLVDKDRSLSALCLNTCIMPARNFKCLSHATLYSAADGLLSAVQQSDNTREARPIIEHNNRRNWFMHPVARVSITYCANYDFCWISLNIINAVSSIKSRINS